MIVFDLECRSSGHRFEGWFGSSEDFSAQQARGLVACPHCGSSEVERALSAPRLTRKSNQLPVAAPRPAASRRADGVAARQQTNAPLAPEAVAMLRAIAMAQAEVLKSSTWVGDKFAEDVRAMHYGDKEHAAIHGQATAEEARALFEEGVEIAPVLFPVAPPGEVH